MQKLVAATVIAYCIALPRLTAAQANVILNYTGNDFTSFFSPYTGTDKVTETIILATQLGDNLNFASVTPLAFSLSDGVQTIDNSNGSIAVPFRFSTSATGAITKWETIVFLSADDSNRIFSLNNIPSEAFVEDGGQIHFPPPQGFAANGNNPGIWTITTVPEPPTVFDLSAGLLGLGLLWWWRRRSRSWTRHHSSTGPAPT